MNPGKVCLPQDIPDAPYQWVLLPGVSPWSPPQLRGPLHTPWYLLVSQTAWTPWARSSASVPARQVPGPQEPTFPPTLPQNMTLCGGAWPCSSCSWGWILPCPAGSSAAGQCRSHGCLRCHRRVCSAHTRGLVEGGRGAERGGGGGGHGMGTASAVAALCWQHCAGPAMSLSLQGAAAVPTSFPLYLLTAAAHTEAF